MTRSKISAPSRSDTLAPSAAAKIVRIGWNWLANGSPTMKLPTSVCETPHRHGGVALGLEQSLRHLRDLAASVWPKRMSTPVLVGCGLIFVGGWSRLSGPDLSLVFGPRLIGSLAAELLGIPVLALWVWRTRNTPSAEIADALIV